MTTLAIDGSYTLHRAKNVIIPQANTLYKDLLARGVDEERAKEQTKQTITPHSITSVFFKMLPGKLEEFHASKVYVLWDQGRCTYRVNLFNEYKVARTQKPKTFIDIAAEIAYTSARNYLHAALPSIGIASMLVPGVEADDLAYYLSHTNKYGVMISDDKDWFLNLNEHWALCRPMRSGSDYYTDWKQFKTEMLAGHTAGNIDPRNVYLYQKACIGDKDEIPRITTPTPAKRIAEFLVGLRDGLIEKDRSIMESSLEDIKRNLQLADTNWLIKDPTIQDMPTIIDATHKLIVIGSRENFWQFASDTRSMNYATRWSQISKKLNYTG